jgi:spectrin beta
MSSAAANGVHTQINGHNSQQDQNNFNIEQIGTDFDLAGQDECNSSARMFERTRIQVLADERGHVQKKTFTKWVNSHLTRVGCRITDLYTDLADGRMLIRLLEILSGERLPKATRGKMRIHCLENVDKAIMFLQEQHVHLENIGYVKEEFFFFLIRKMSLILVRKRKFRYSHDKKFESTGVKYA